MLHDRDAVEMSVGKVRDLAAGVFGGAQAERGEEVPIAQVDRQLDVRVDVDAADVAGVEVGFGTVEVADGGA